jgi:hypothetical protein
MYAAVAIDVRFPARAGAPTAIEIVERAPAIARMTGCVQPSCTTLVRELLGTRLDVA